MCVSLAVSSSTLYTINPYYGGATQYLNSFDTSTGELNYSSNNIGKTYNHESLAYGDNSLFWTNYSGEIIKYDLETETQSSLANVPTGVGGFINTGNLVYAPVPLPAGIYLFLSGLVGLGLMRGRNA